MRLKLDVPVIDISLPPDDGGKPVQAKLNNQPATLRGIVTLICTTQGITVDPQTKARSPETPAEAAEAYAVGLRAYNVALGEDLELTIPEASMLKTRAYIALPPLYAGALDVALESAAEKAQPPAAKPD